MGDTPPVLPNFLVMPRLRVPAAYPSIDGVGSSPQLTSGGVDG